jgi:hypothetical protein
LSAIVAAIAAQSLSVLAPGDYRHYRRRTRAKIVPGDQLLHP